MSEVTNIKISIYHELFESDEAAEAAKIFTENNRKLMRNYIAMAAEELNSISLADLGINKYLEVRGKLQGEIAAYNNLLNLSSEVAQTTLSN